MLPYYLLSVNYDLSLKSSKELQKLMVFGDFKLKLGIIDQLIYFIKELMLESPEDFLIIQFF